MDIKWFIISKSSVAIQARSQDFSWGGGVYLKNLDQLINCMMFEW